jgi:hypothetical protein
MKQISFSFIVKISFGTSQKIFVHSRKFFIPEIKHEIYYSRDHTHYYFLELAVHSTF